MDAKLLSFKSTPLFVASYVAKHVFETHAIPVAVVGCEQARPRGLEESPTHMRQYFHRLAGGRDWGKPGLGGRVLEPSKLCSKLAQQARQHSLL